MRKLVSRRRVLVAGALLSMRGARASGKSGGQKQRPIDRQALVTRHNVVLTKLDGERPLQVGNGEFAFGMDVTGLQTFAPFNTMSHWGWHSVPPPAGQNAGDFQGQVWETHGRPVRYPMPDPQHPELSEWLAANPHRLNLGRLGLTLTKKDGVPAAPRDLGNVQQTLDLWTGIVTSRFEVDGDPVTVTTACHPSLDAVAVQVESPLIAAGRLSVFLDCPGDDLRSFANFVGDRGHPVRLEPLAPPQSGRVDLERRIDGNSVAYHVSLAWKSAAELRLPKADVSTTLKVVKAEYGAGDKWLDVTDVAAKAVVDGRLSLHVSNALGPDPAPGLGKSLRVTYMLDGVQHVAVAPENGDIFVDGDEARHRIFLQPAAGSGMLSFVCAFSKELLPKTLPDAEATFAASRQKWPAFWQGGGAIDLSESRDPRWHELERRIVLSQYLLEVNEAGSLPPQESGLVNNGWYGRFHLEMYWWHAAHWALWNRWPQLNRSLGLYDRLLVSSRERALAQGYRGARWPKCIGPDGREWPNQTHALLIWQQPHPIFFAELDYRAHPTRATLEKWQPVVEATADFLASYAFLDETSQRYVLGPPLIPVSENTPPKTTQNPAFELGYWRYGLRTAQEWRTRLGLPRNAEWDKVANGLSPLPEQDGVYVLYEGVPDMWTKFNFEHPALTGVLGILPGDGVDIATMHRTLDKVEATWNFNHTWGWDFPMLAMCAARLGEPDRAIDFLLTSAPGFQFDARGLATGGPFPYFPSNGGLLYAVAMLAAGWDGAPKRHAPGFPEGGAWTVRWEGLNSAV